MPFGIAHNSFNLIKNVFTLNSNIDEAIIFGSRALGTERLGSDVDIAIKGNNLKIDDILTLKNQLLELPLAYDYDIVIYKNIKNEEFTEHINHNGITFYKKEILPSEWKKYKLGDLGFFFGGVTTISKEDYGHGTPFLPYKNVYKNSKVNVNELELMNIRPQDIERRSAKYGDIFFTASSETPDEVAMSSVLLDDVENLTYNGFCKRYRLNDFNTLLPEYARYLFRDINFRREVYQVATGDIRFNISQESLAKIEIEIPDVATQAQLAEILMKLDDKIELNLQMNQTLEAMAQALFKEWFVNFNFPNFDGELENGLPKGWSYKSIKDLGKVVTGNTPSSKNPEYFGEVTPFVTPTDFKNFGKLIIGANRYLSVQGSKAMKTRLLPKHSIIVTCIGSDMGKVAINSIECVTNQQINSIIPNDKSYVDYLYYDLVYKYDYLRNIATGGSTMPIINKSRFEEIEILIPNSDVLENFQVLMDSFNSKIEENIRQTQSLTQTRDTLLPKLMSGKLELV